MEDQGGGSVRIEKLTDSNFYVWKQKIQILLALKDVSEHVTEREDPGVPNSDEHKQWLRSENKAKAIIGLYRGRQKVAKVGARAKSLVVFLY